MKIGYYYTEEQINFLRQEYTYTPITKKELREKFNKKFNEARSKLAIVNIISKNKIKKDKKYRNQSRERGVKYTNEHSEYIRRNYTEKPTTTQQELLKMFNKEFNFSISVFTLGMIISKNKLAKGPIYTDEVKQFIIKCVKEGMRKQDCKEACEAKFKRHFYKQNIGKVVNEVGLSFAYGPLMLIDKFFEEHEGVEKLIQRVIKKNLKSKYQDILIRDAIIEKYEINTSTRDILKFCESKNIKITYLSQEIIEKRKKERRVERLKRKKEIKYKTSSGRDYEFEEYM